MHLQENQFPLLSIIFILLQSLSKIVVPHMSWIKTKVDEVEPQTNAGFFWIYFSAIFFLMFCNNLSGDGERQEADIHIWCYKKSSFWCPSSLCKGWSSNQMVWASKLLHIPQWWGHLLSNDHLTYHYFKLMWLPIFLNFDICMLRRHVL